MTRVERMHYPAPLGQVEALEIRRRPVHSHHWASVPLRAERILDEARLISFDPAGQKLEQQVARLRREHGLRVAFEWDEVGTVSPYEWPQFAGERAREMSRQTRESNRLVGRTADGLLEALLSDIGYVVKQEGPTRVILPREGSRLGYPVRLNTRGLSVDEAVRAIFAQVPAEETWHAAGQAVFITTDERLGRFSQRLPAPVMVLERVTAAEGLTRLLNAMKPAMIWTVEWLNEAAMVSLETVAEDETARAIRVAHAWLEGVDEGGYDASWREAGAVFRGAITQAAWVATLHGWRGPMGDAQARWLTGMEEASRLPGVPDGRFLVLTWEAHFTRKQSAVETLTLQREADGRWRVAGYFIR